MAVRYLDDIERDKKRETNRRIAEDINQMIKEIFPPRKPKVKKKRWKLIKILGFLFLLIFMINLVLGNLWLLKFFIKDLFFGG